MAGCGEIREAEEERRAHHPLIQLDDGFVGLTLSPLAARMAVTRPSMGAGTWLSISWLR